MLLQHVTQIVDVVVQNQLSGNLRSGIAAINCVSCGPTCKGFMVPLSAICYVPAAILRSHCQHFLIFLFPRLLVPHVRVYGPIVGNLLFYAVPASLVPTCKRYRSHRCQFVSKVMIKRPWLDENALGRYSRGWTTRKRAKVRSIKGWVAQGYVGAHNQFFLFE
jgi:hypothetical protein